MNHMDPMFVRTRLLVSPHGLIYMGYHLGNAWTPEDLMVTMYDSTSQLL